jgi:hypothetical protein
MGQLGMHYGAMLAQAAQSCERSLPVLTHVVVLLVGTLGSARGWLL